MRCFCLVVLVACGRAATPEPVVTGSGLGAGSATSAPAADGQDVATWVEVRATEERLRCANHADEEWEVRIDGDRVLARKQVDLEPNLGPDLPFPLPGREAFRGRRTVVAVADGFIVGHDAGEWGGSLYWFSRDGAQERELATENVASIVELGGEVLVFEGLSHLGIDEGRVRWLGRDASGWSQIALANLDGAARTAARAGDAVYVITTQGLSRIDASRKPRTVQTVPNSGLYPDSMAVDAHGTVWVGMRQLVLQLVPDRGRYAVHWRAPPGCAEAHQVDLDCICDR